MTASHRESVDEALTTTRAFRRKLDLTRPVEREVIEECLNVASHAPTGSNRQGWRFVVVDRPDTKNAVAQIYRRGFADNISGRTPTPQQRVEFESAAYLAEHLHEAPVLVLACQSGRLPADASAKQLAGFYGSVYPAVWSFMVALRSRGIGSSFTTAHLTYERDVAEVLGIPYDDVTQVALLPVAYLKTNAGGRSRRNPVPVHWNSWGPDC